MSRKRKSYKLNQKKTGIIAILAVICLVGIYTFNFSTKSEVIAKQGITFKEFDSEFEVRDEIEIQKDDGGVYIIFPEKVDSYFVQQYFVEDNLLPQEEEEDVTNTVNENTIAVDNTVDDTNTIPDTNTTNVDNTIFENIVTNTINTNTVLENVVSNTTVNETNNTNTIIDTLSPSTNTISNVVAGETKNHLTSNDVEIEDDNEENNNSNDEEVKEEVNSEDTNTIADSQTENNDTNTNTNTNTVTNTTSSETTKKDNTVDTPSAPAPQNNDEEKATEENEAEEESEELPTKDISNIIPFEGDMIENNEDIEIPGKISYKPGDKIYIDQEAIDNDDVSIEVKFKTIIINGTKLYNQELIYESALVRVVTTGFVPREYTLDVNAESIEKVEELKADVAELSDATVLGAYNIKIVNGEDEYQPVNYFQALKVSITSQEQFANNLINNSIKIIHIKEDEEKNEIIFEKIALANKTEDTVECQTNEFSTYAILRDDSITESEITVYNYDTEYDYYIGRDFTDNDGTAAGKYTDDTLAKVNIKYYGYDTSRSINDGLQLTESDMDDFDYTATNQENVPTTVLAYDRYYRRYNPQVTIRRNNGQTINNTATWTMSFTVPKEIMVDRIVADNTALGVSNATYTPTSDTNGTLTITGSRLPWPRSNNNTYTADLVLYMDLIGGELSQTYNNQTITNFNALTLSVVDGANTYNNTNSTINRTLGNYTDDINQIDAYTRYVQKYELDVSVESKPGKYIDINDSWSMSFTLPKQFIINRFTNDNSGLNIANANFYVDSSDATEGTLTMNGNSFGSAWERESVSKYTTKLVVYFDMIPFGELVPASTFTPLTSVALSNKTIRTGDRILMGYISHKEAEGDDPGERQNLITYTTCVPIVNGSASIDLIDNPFMDRPADFGFNGWKVKTSNSQFSSAMSGATISTDPDTFAQKLSVSGISHTPGTEYTIVLEADWQVANIVFLGGTGSSDSNSGRSITKPVNTMGTAYRILTNGKKTATAASNRELNILVLLGGDHTTLPFEARKLRNPNNNNYLWVFENVSGNQYKLRNVGSNSYLRIETTGGGWGGPTNTRSLTTNANATVFTVNQDNGYASFAFSNTYTTGGFWGGTYTYNGYLTIGGASTDNTQLALLDSTTLTPKNIDGANTYLIVDTSLTNALIRNNNNVNSQALQYDTDSTPYTITSIYNGVDYRNYGSLVAGTTSFPFDMQFDFVKLAFSGGYELERSNTSTSNITQANGHNIRIGRGIQMPNNHTATAEAFMCGPSGTNRVVIESGKYNVLNQGRTAYSSGDITITNEMIMGNDIDRLEDDNTSMSVYHRVSSRTGSGNASPAKSGRPMFKMVVKSGTYGVEGFNDFLEDEDDEYAYSGIYIGGLTYANNDYGDRELYVEGGNIANIIGGLALPANSTAKTNIYVKDGNVINIVGGAGRSTTHGNRIVQVTGGTVQYSVNGGSNGYFSDDNNGDNSKGKLEGKTLVYIGGNAKIGTDETEGDTLYGVEAGCVLGAGNGNANATEAGQVKSSHIIIDGNAKVLGSVYGGGNYGVVGARPAQEATGPKITLSNANTGDLTSNNGLIFYTGNYQAYLNNNNRTAVQQLTNVNSFPNDNALWIFENVSGNNYRIKNKATGRYLSNNNSGGNGNRYFNTTDNVANARSFTVAPNGNSFRITYVDGGRTYYLQFRDNNSFYARDTVANVNIYKWAEIVVEPDNPSEPGVDEGNVVVQIDILGGDVSQNVYGGSNQNNIYGSTEINMIGGSTEGAYQGGTGSTEKVGTVEGAIYGGSNEKGTISENATINLQGGTVGTVASGTNTETDAVFGGGKGHDTTISGFTYINATDGEDYDLVVNGSIYGGSEEGKVVGNSLISIKDDVSTTQKIVLNSNVYGGGKGTDDIAAQTGGYTKVVIDGGDYDNDKTQIYGGCNVNGTINGTIDVKVGETANTSVYQVYGGGNQADVTNITEHVYVDIYSNAEVDAAFNGGNNAGIDGTETQTARKITVDGGTVGDLYGGSNNEGDLTETHVEVKNSATINNVYGGGYGESTNINGPTDILISDSTIATTADDGKTGNVYGGGNAGKVIGDTSVVITTTEVQNNVYGGGLGEDATVSGDTSVDISDTSSVHNVYGGGNAGKVEGDTEVNVDEIIGDNVYGGGCAAAVDGKTTVTVDNSLINNNVYGGGEGETAFVGTEDEPTSTTVVVKQTSGSTLVKNVYGGGDAGEVRGTTSVTVTGVQVVEDVYGGGNQADVTEDTDVSMDSAKAKNVYGGGNAGNVNGVTVVTIDNASKISENVYGGGNQGNVDENTVVTIDNASEVSGNVYGGGNQGAVGTDTAVTIDNASSISGDVYGGGNQGAVGTDTIVTIANVSTVSGDVFGGGNQGNVDGSTLVMVVDASEISGDVFGGGNRGNVSEDATVYVTDSIVAKSVFGGGKMGQVDGDTDVEVTGSIITDSIYGGGNQGNVLGIANVIVDATDVENSIYGGGKAADVAATVVSVVNGTEAQYVYGGGDQGKVTTAGTDVAVSNSTIGHSIYGGGNGSATGTNEGSVTGGTKVLVDNGTNVFESVFGAGRGVSATTVGDTDVDIISVTIGEDVYGGGDNGIVIGSTDVNLYEASITGSAYAAGNGANALVRDGTHIVAQADTTIGKSLFGGGNAAPTGPESPTWNSNIYAIVDVAGAEIGENVYGGANSSVIYGNTVVNIGTGAIAEYYGENKHYEQTTIDIGGTVFGGGEQMDPTKPYNFDTISVEGYIDINIDGDGYDTDGIDIHGSIFGSGNASRAALPTSPEVDNNGNVTIRNYGTIDDPKKLVSIQRTGEVKIDNSALLINGTTDSTSSHPEAYFTLNRIEKLTIKNESTLYLRNGANILKKFYSMSGPDDNEQIASVTINDGEITNSNVINRLYMYSGINLNVSPAESLETYGEVKGMTYFGIYKMDESGDDTIQKGIYDEGYNSTTIAWDDRDYTSCYVSGMHYKEPEHNIYVDGFFTTYEVFTIDGNPSYDPPDDVTISAENYASLNTYPKIDYIDPTPEDEIYYMWITGPNDNVFYYPMNLFASKYSTFSAKELNLLGISYKNATMRITKVESDLEDGIGLYPRNTIPNVNPDPDAANNNFGLAMKTGNNGWSMNGSTEFTSQNNVGSYGGDTEYRIENSTTTPTLSFYLYHSNNITEAKELGYYRIYMTLSYWKDDLNMGRATVIIDLTLATLLYNDFGYNGSITPGRQYDLFSSTETNITSKSSFSTYFELAEPNFSTNEKVLNYYDDSYRVITTTYAFPENTTITMIDRSDNDNPKYYYYIVTAADKLSGKNTFRLDEFREMGSTDKYYDELAERDNYYMDSLDYEYESFIFTVDLESAKFTAQDIDAEKKICVKQPFRIFLNADIDGHTETLFSLLDEQIDSIQYSIYDSESLIDIDANLSKQRVYRGNTSTLNVNTNYTITIVDGARVYDTRYFDQKLGAKLTFYKKGENNEYVQVSGSELLGTYFSINGENYYPRADGTTRIKLAEKVSNCSSAVIIHTENSSLSGDYLIHIDSFGSADGVYYGIKASDSAEVSLTIVDNIFGLDSHLPDAQTIIDMTTGHTMEPDTGYTSATDNKLDFTIDYQSGLSAPLISVKLYRRDYDTPDTLTYTLVDLADYVSESLENINVENEYLAISTSDILSKVTNAENTTTYDLEYTLKQNLTSGTYKVTYTLYDYEEQPQYEEVENPDGSISMVELDEKLKVYNFIGSTFSYIVIK